MSSLRIQPNARTTHNEHGKLQMPLLLVMVPNGTHYPTVAMTGNGELPDPVPSVPDRYLSPPPSRTFNQPSPNMPPSWDTEVNLDPCFKFVTADSLAWQAGTNPHTFLQPKRRERPIEPPLCQLAYRGTVV